MKKFSLLIAVGVVMFRMTACDIVEAPFSKVFVPPPPGQKVLLEEFTGAKCGNCPDGTAIALSIDSLYAPQVISIGIHVGSYAVPNPSGTKYRYDFRSATGSELDQAFGPAEIKGMPNGMVNRLSVNGQYLLSKDAWRDVVDSVLRRKPKLTLAIANSYNDGTRMLTTTATVHYLAKGDSTHQLALYITEDSIVTWQHYYPPEGGSVDIPEYVHRHALRGSMNGTWGDRLSPGAIADSSTFMKTYSMQLDSAWNPSHCNVVAFVNDGVSREIIQAEETKVK